MKLEPLLKRAESVYYCAMYNLSLAVPTPTGLLEEAAVVSKIWSSKLAPHQIMLVAPCTSFASKTFC